MCRYHFNRALKTGDHQANNPAATNGITNRRNAKSRYRQRRKKTRQLDDHLLSARKENEYYNDMAENVSKHNKTNIWKYYVHSNDVDIIVKSGVNIMLIWAPETKDSQADKPTDGTAICRNDKSRCHQRRNRRQLDDPMFSMRKEKEYYNDIR